MIKRIFISFFFASFICANSFSQANTPKERKLSINEQEQMEKAQYLYEQKNYRLALPVFEKLLEKHPSDNRVKYYTALCYASRPDKHPLMLQYLNEVYAANKKADRIEYELARANFFNYKFDDASDYLKQYTAKNKKAAEKEQKEINTLTDNIKSAKSLAANPINVKITNLGNVVNTAASECSPFVDVNDSILIYTYRGEFSTGGLQNAYNEPDKHGVYYEDVFISTKENDTWTKPRSINAVNSNNNDEALSISYDGTMLFTSRDSPEDDGDIYMSKLTANGWGPANKLLGGVNTPAWEDNCCLSPDGKTLYFCSSRGGGFGGKDIYKSIMQYDSTWGPAINLGDKINTPEDEDDPFIHLDGKLFLFSSKGHNSMGGYDIFKTYMLQDSSWSVPENIGYPINTPDDDIHYSLSPGGDKGYYGISRPDGFGDVDLYTVEPGITGIMPAMLVVKGMVMFDNKPAEANIEVLVNGAVYKKGKSNAGSGLYQLVLPLGQDYKITWRLDTLTQTETIEAANAKEYMLKIKDALFKGTPNAATVYADSIAAGSATGNEIVEGLIYKIQVAAHRKNRNVDYKKIKEYGKVEKIVVDDMPRFTLSKEYKTLNKVNEALEQVRKIAVPDAFVICWYKGKRCYLFQLWKQGIIPEQKQ